MNSLNNPKCTRCGSYNVTRFELNSCYEHLVIGKIYYKKIHYKCRSCKEEMDIFSETERNYNIAEKQAIEDTKIAIKEMDRRFNNE